MLYETRRNLNPETAVISIVIPKTSKKYYFDHLNPRTIPSGLLLSRMSPPSTETNLGDLGETFELILLEWNLQ